MVRIAVGDIFPIKQLKTVSKETINIVNADKVLHLQLRRFAGCPICDLHLQSFVKRYEDIRRADIEEVVLFHSTDEEIRQYEADLPFKVVADPRKDVYKTVGVESSVSALLDLRILQRMPFFFFDMMKDTMSGKRKLAPFKPNGGVLACPADFIIGKDGHVLAVKYGEHAYDQWSVDEMLRHASSTDI